ncbi:MAG: hypothetical protein JSV85_06515 [Candidatus Bathyarchaeota archaeon]|nr:MAG: hypothetical protein JSV85_06515 [Candidatus Bathyarchaeota archaeon]
MKLVKTQITQLDEILGGGLPDKSVVLMLGEPGSGHDTLAQQILYQHALWKGKVAYFTTSRSSSTLTEDFEAFGWMTSTLKTDRWTFIDVHVPTALQILQKEMPMKLREGHWTVIDSLSYLLLTQEYRPVLNSIELLLDSTRKHGGIHFLLLTQGMHDSQKEITVQHLVDGVIELVAQKAGDGVDRRIRIKKMKKTNCTPKLIPFSISENGIAIETAVRIA